MNRKQHRSFIRCIASYVTLECLFFSSTVTVVIKTSAAEDKIDRSSIKTSAADDNDIVVLIAFCTILYYFYHPCVPLRPPSLFLMTTILSCCNSQSNILTFTWTYKPWLVHLSNHNRRFHHPAPFHFQTYQQAPQAIQEQEVPPTAIPAAIIAVQ